MDYLNQKNGKLVKGGLLTLAVCVLVITASCGVDQPTTAERGGWPPRIGSSPHNGPETVLTITGLVNRGEDVYLDLETIVGLPTTTFTSFDPWTELTIEFTGVTLFDLLAALELDSEASSIIVHAVDDYEVAIDLAHLAAYEYLLCYQEDGLLHADYTNERDKGPFSIAIDFDKFNGIDVERAKYDSVWWIDEITVL